MHKTLEKSPADRYESMEQLANKLDRAFKFADGWVREHEKNPSKSRAMLSGSRIGLSSSSMRPITSTSGFKVGSPTYRRGGNQETTPSQGMETVVVNSGGDQAAQEKLRSIIETFRLQIIVGGAALLFLAVLTIFWLTRGPDPNDFVAQDLKVLQGLKQVVLQWQSKAPYSSEALLGEKEGNLVTYKGTGGKEKEHRIKVEGLEVDRPYMFRLVYPNGEKSLPHRFSLPKPTFLFTMSSQDDNLYIYGNCSIAARASVSYKSKGESKTAQAQEGDSFEVRHTFKIESFAPNSGDKVLKVRLLLQTGEVHEIEGSQIRES